MDCKGWLDIARRSPKDSKNGWRFTSGPPRIDLTSLSAMGNELDERSPGPVDASPGPWPRVQVTLNVDEDVTSPDHPMRVTIPVLAPDGTVTTSFLAVSDTMEAWTPPMSCPPAGSPSM
jgi:hypothetical protein